MSSASAEDLALQVLMPSFEGPDLPDDWADLLRAGLGGICLFGSNIGDGSGVPALTAAIHAANPACVITTDEEGGDVTRLHALTGSPVPGPAALGALHDLTLTRTVGGLVGADLAAAGIDLDLGPVADVNSNPDNPVIGTRSFGSDPGIAAEHVAAWVRGLQETGVAACVKHFPGHGDTGEDSHLALPVLDVPLTTLRERELLPFAAAVAAGTRAVMTSHIVVPALDPELPATLSPVVLGLLRDELGFDGVIVSDALDMAGASASRGIPEAAVLSLAAGADFLCVGPDKPASLVREIQAAIVDAVDGGRLAFARLEEAAARVAALGSPDVAGRAGADSGGRVASASERIETALRDAAAQALVVEGELPDLAGAMIVSVDSRANIAVGDVPWGLPPDLVVQAGGTVSVLGSGPLIVQVRDAHRRPEVGVLLGRLADLGATPVVIEWGWPGPGYGSFARICTRGYSRPGAEAVTELLRKAGWDR
ncbi:glycoside hydrolase family 3 N-terminal domain-containing protein [Nocardioides sp. CER19]|uniref:glycoside hydrolase family 3 protein n=1 Tax=Nocardioides sp. CER19 TaxID=3038538 RepID=UPI002449CEA1|nr:glycoside hydrolase family 3 N-terminal domain-containing protein [Nocardioides sp. CER19]MDH2413171.1 glycoside hydrolase family 3 N-terminal domain-containing protein [Nocardioides sp. CER19]